MINQALTIAAALTLALGVPNDRGRPLRTSQEVGANEGALHRAAAEGDIERLDELLAAGGKVVERDRFGQTPLHVAVLYGNHLVVRYLAMLIPAASMADQGGLTPLHWACAAGDAQSTALLALTRLRDERSPILERTALHFAAIAGDQGCIQVLLNAGSDPRAKDANGRTALDYLEQLAAVKAPWHSSPEPTSNRYAEPELGRGALAVQIRISPGNPFQTPRGMSLAAWSDGVVLFARSMGPFEQEARVGRIGPDSVHAFLSSLSELGLTEFSDTDVPGAHGSGTTLQVSLPSGIRNYTFGRSTYLHQYEDGASPGSVRFALAWKAALDTAQLLTPAASEPLQSVQARNPRFRYSGKAEPYLQPIWK